ncbi:MAG TPA: RNA polymerase-associated protein rapA, partial [Gammaproteobacteria bacterium]|nr:RNA polymerase-associated protein rapA [Gammaproteobacteria bacterium]
MFVKSPLGMAIASLLIAPLCAQAEVEVSAELKNETAFFTKSGQVTGKPVGMLDNREHDAGDLMKFENSARIFINGDLGERSSWHVELRPVYDTEGVNGYQGHKSYTQNDYLREAYIDTKVSDWYLRLGKQQVVWGTADGIKLLDI